MNSTEKSNPNTPQIHNSFPQLFCMAFSPRQVLEVLLLQTAWLPVPRLPPAVPRAQVKGPRRMQRAGRNLPLALVHFTWPGKAGPGDLFSPSMCQGVLGRTCFYMRETEWIHVPDRMSSEMQNSSHSFSESCCCYTPANSFDPYILFDQGTGLPGKVSVIRSISLPSITSQVSSIKCHAGMSEGRRPHAAPQALKNNLHVPATPGRSFSINSLPTLECLWMCRQVVDAPPVVLYLAGYWGH